VEAERYDQTKPNPASLRAAGKQRFVFDIVDVVEIGNSGRTFHRLN
jgi:hypothetical protein